MQRRISKIERHSWCADIISPFDFVSKNINVSDKYDRFFSHVIGFYEYREEDERGKTYRSGIHIKEGKSCPYGYKFHGGDLINNEF